MTVVPIATRAAAVRGTSSAVARTGGSSKVIDVTPTKSRPLSTPRPRGGRVADATAGAGASKLLDGIPGSKGLTDAVAPQSAARRVLVAEFAVCMVVLAFSPLTDKNRSEPPGRFMKRASATMAVFFILALIATAGRGAARASAAFGGLVALVLLISQRSIFTTLTAKLGAGVGEDDGASEGLLDPDVLDDIGDDIADIGDDLNKITPLPPRGPGGNGGVW